MTVVDVMKKFQRGGQDMLKKSYGNAVDTTKQLSKGLQKNVFPVVDEMYDTKNKVMKELKDNPLAFEIAKGVYESAPNSVQSALKYGNKAIDSAKQGVDNYDDTKKQIAQTSQDLKRDIVADVKNLW
jgi:hypothetical protein